MKWNNLYHILTIIILFIIPIEPFLHGAYDYIKILYISIFLIVFISKKKKKSQIYIYDILMIIFLAFSIFSNLYTAHALSSVTMAKELLINIILSMGISYNLFISKKMDKAFNSQLYAFICGTLIMSLYLLLIELPQLGRWGRLGYDLFENYGSFMVFSYSCIISSCYLIWDIFIKDYEENIIKKKIIKAIMLIIIFMGAFASGTRKSLLCPIIFIIISLYLKYKKRFLKLFVSIFVMGIVVFSGYKLIMTNEVFYNRIGVRIETMISSLIDNSNEDGSMNEREILRMLSIKAWKEKPIVGHGLHSFRYYSLLHNGPYLYSHCNYTELLSTLGIIGFLLYYSAYIYLIVACIKYRKKNKYYIFFLAFLLMNLVSDYSTISYYRQHYLIIFFTISRAILKNKNEERNVIK